MGTHASPSFTSLVEAGKPLGTAESYRVRLAAPERGIGSMLMIKKVASPRSCLAVFRF